MNVIFSLDVLKVAPFIIIIRGSVNHQHRLRSQEQQRIVIETCMESFRTYIITWMFYPLLREMDPFFGSWLTPYTS